MKSKIIKIAIFTSFIAVIILVIAFMINIKVEYGYISSEVYFLYLLSIFIVPINIIFLAKTRFWEQETSELDVLEKGNKIIKKQIEKKELEKILKDLEN